MAAFRGFTAEEEAASGLMHCLKERNYESADRLKPRDHFQKNAVYPFLVAVGAALGDIVSGQAAKTMLHIREVNGEMRLTHCLKMAVNGQPKLVYPDPPLNFSVTSEGKALSFRQHIDAYVKERGAKDAESHLRQLQNRRNTLLYAGENGYPGDVELAPDFLVTKKTRVFLLLRAYLMIQPYQQQLPFVQDTLNAYLVMLGQIDVANMHDEI
jgi:hypothetical protein